MKVSRKRNALDADLDAVVDNVVAEAVWMKGQLWKG